MEEVDNRQLLREFQDLVKSPAWDRLSKFAEAQMQSRRTQLELPSHERMASEGRALPSDDYVKGEIQGIRLFLKMPSMIVDDMQSIIKHEQEKEDDTGRAENNSDASNTSS